MSLTFQSKLTEIRKATSEKEDDYKNGCECHFIALNEKIGVKLYCSESERDFAYNNQKLAAMHQIGPEVGKRFSLPTPDEHGNYRSYRFGYVTQVAVVATDRVGFFPSWAPKMEKAVKRLNKKMESLGMESSDNNSRNLGFIGKRLVCLDFGRESRGADMQKVKELLKVA